MARRKGIPAIRQRKDKNGKKLDVWECLLNLGRDPSTGKPKRVPIYGKTQGECREKVIAALGQIQTQTFVEPNKITLEQWLNTWLNEYKKGNVRPTTFRDYEAIIRNHLKDIGQTYLKDLRPDTIQRLYNEKTKSGLSPSTVKHIHIVLHEALEQAIKNGVVVRNVTEATILPKIKKKEMRVLSIEEQIKFLNATRNYKLGLAFRLSLATGLRMGELLGLTWKNVNLKDGYIRVTQTVSRVKTFNENISTKTEIIIQEPKTKSGKRTIPLVDSIINELKEYKETQRKDRTSLGLSELYDGYVFATVGECKEIIEGKEVVKIEYKPIEPRNFARVFYSIVKNSGIKKANLHSLRHTFATRLLEANEHPKVVQEMLGHSSINMTLDTYSHVLPELKKSAVSKLNNLFENTSKENSAT